MELLVTEIKSMKFCWQKKQDNVVKFVWLHERDALYNRVFWNPFFYLSSTVYNYVADGQGVRTSA